jgi:multidrug efflux pump subunit AcrA (membrane-fusion protein)
MRRRALLRTSVVVAALALSGCGLHGKPKVDRSKALATSHAPQGATAPDLAEPDRVVAPGIVEAWGGNVDLSPKESGWISSIAVAEGDAVAAGQVLAVLDDETQRAAVDVAKADLAEAQATLDRTMHGSTAEDIRQARAEAEASRARAELAERDAARTQRLGEDRALAPAEVERSAADARASAATARAADAKLAAFERGSRSEDRSIAQSRVDAARARLALAEANLERRQVVAPIAGVVLLSRWHAGEFFGVGGAPLFVLGDTSKLQVRLEVDEVDAFRVHDRAACALFADDNGKVGGGTVYRIAPELGRRGLAIESPTARADVRVREVFVEAPGSSSLVPGQRVWGHITPATSSDSTLTVLEASHGH